jgi:glucose-6-phosphate isomerase
MISLIKGETINFDKIYSDNLNIKNSSCKLEVITVDIKNNEVVLKTIQANKKDNYFQAIIQTNDINTKEFLIIITIQENEIIAKEKLEFKFN